MQVMASSAADGCASWGGQGLAHRSVPTGRRVMAEAGAGVKHATMEWAASSPLIIFEGDAGRRRDQRGDAG